MTNDDHIKVCPNCDSYDINLRVGKYGRVRRAPGKRYFCSDCEHGFDIPAERERPPEADSHGNLGIDDETLQAARDALGIETDP